MALLVPDLPSPDHISSPVVRIEVGPSKVNFFIHKSLLCACSSYFNAALNSNFKEGTDQAITFPDEDPNIFRIFAGWVYYRKFKNDSGGLSDEYSCTLTQKTFCQLWIFGDKRGIPDLQNMAIDAWHDQVYHNWKYPTTDIVNYVYENTVLNNGLRRIIVEAFMIPTIPSRMFKEDTPRGPVRFLSDVIVRLLEVSTTGWGPRTGRVGWKDLDLCRFHVHKEGEKCIRQSQMER